MVNPALHKNSTIYTQTKANKTKPGLGAFNANQSGNGQGLFYSSCGLQEV